MSYVDGFVIPIPKKNLPAYRKMAKLGCKVWMDHGALDYRECIGESLDTTFGMSMTKLTKAKAGETVVFAWITYKSRKHRDRVNAAVMKDKRMAAAMTGKMPFDIKRMANGGFAGFVEA
jgi:uncharacterized protein YbaA (DUF1428 family)